MTDVQGYIKDKETTEPLIGAHVILEDKYSGEMVSGTVTDATGYFSMEKRPATVARVSYIGYTTSYPIIYTGDARDYYLERSSTELDEAVIIAIREKGFDYRIIVLVAIVLIAVYLMNK
tara:strand:- start:767 stop:1123 length:357 start_codon:yes stop_codon:yes gene_type:complete